MPDPIMIHASAQLVPYRMRCHYCYSWSIVYFHIGESESYMEPCGYTCSPPETPQRIIRDVPEGELQT